MACVAPQAAIQYAARISRVGLIALQLPISASLERKAGQPAYRALFLLQSTAYFGVIAVTPHVLRGRRIGPFFVPYYFISVNFAILLGFLKFCSRSQSSLWEPTTRTDVAL